MPALLSLIPGRVWLYGVIAAVLLGFIVHYKHLETEVHQTTAAGKAAIATVKKDDATAQATETQNAIIYKKAILIPAVGDIGVSCVRVNPRGSQVPAAGAGATAAVGQPAANGPEGPPYDPSGSVLTRGRDADAQIAYLQARIKELEAQMNGAP